MHSENMELVETDAEVEWVALGEAEADADIETVPVSVESRVVWS